MSKDILDKLELKNYENLSSNRSNDSAIGMSRDLDNLKINDDFSNDEFLEDEYSIIENNSYIDLSDIVGEDGIADDNYKSKTDISGITLKND